MPNRSDLRTALRSLARRPGYVAVAVLTLALGIGANTAVFSVVDAVLLSPLPFPEPDRLAMLVTESQGLEVFSFSPANFLDLRRDNRSFEGLASFMIEWKTLEGREPVQLRTAAVSANFLDLLGVPPALGRGLGDGAVGGDDGDGRATGEATLVLSHGLWQRHFDGDPGVLGRTLVLDDVPHVVTGVASPSLDFPRDVEAWVRAPDDVARLPLSSPDEDTKALRGGHYLRVLGRLADGVSVAQARDELTALGDRLAEEYPDANAGREIDLRGLQDWMVGDVRPALLVLLGAVTFVLILTCANVAHLVLARTHRRRREIAIRTALGAGRANLGGLLLTESLLLALAGGGLGVLLAVWGLEGILALAPEDLPRLADVGLDGRALLWATGVSVATGVLFGLVPALRAPRLGLGDVLKSGGRNASAERSHRRRRSLLMVSQFALSLVLLVGAGLLLRSFLRVQAVDVGFEPQGVVAVDVSLPLQRYLEEHHQRSFFNELLAGLRARPAIRQAGLVLTTPGSGSNITLELAVEGQAPREPGNGLTTGFQTASPGYFETLEIPLLAGRAFGPGDHAEAPGVVVINRRAAEDLWPGENPVGQRLTFDTPPDEETEWSTVVGVVGDVHHDGPAEVARREVYAPLEQATFPFATLVVRGNGEPLDLVPAIRAQVRALDPALALGEATVLARQVDSTVGARRFLMTLVAGFAALALILAAVGLYGVTAQAVGERVREIGIRLALGSRRRQVLALVLRQTAVLALTGIGLGVLAALALNRLLRGLLFEVEPTDPLTLMAVSGLLLIAALLAGLVPALGAARTDPARTLAGD